jgi:hypothetical protein
MIDRRFLWVASLFGTALAAGCQDRPTAPRGSSSVAVSPGDTSAKGVIRVLVVGEGARGLAMALLTRTGPFPSDTTHPPDTMPPPPPPPDTTPPPRDTTPPPRDTTPPPRDTTPPPRDTTPPPRDTTPPPRDTTGADSTQAPVANAEIQVFHLVPGTPSPGDTTAVLVASGRTDAHGRLELTSVPAGQFRLDVFPPADSPFGPTRFWAVVGSEGVVNVTIVVPRR